MGFLSCDHSVQGRFKMASHSQGIQQLLTAEKKAADLVSEARKRKYLEINYPPCLGRIFNYLRPSFLLILLAYRTSDTSLRPRVPSLFFKINVR
jgi:hypothetical protein